MRRRLTETDEVIYDSATKRRDLHLENSPLKQREIRIQKAIGKQALATKNGGVLDNSAVQPIAVSQGANTNNQENTNQSDGSTGLQKQSTNYEDNNEDNLDRNDGDFQGEEIVRPTSNNGFLVEINLDRSGKKEVQWVNMNGRVPTRAKNQGHHIVAFGLLGLAVKESMRKKSYKEAVEGIALILGGKNLVRNLKENLKEALLKVAELRIKLANKKSVNSETYKEVLAPIFTPSSNQSTAKNSDQKISKESNNSTSKNADHNSNIGIQDEEDEKTFFTREKTKNKKFKKMTIQLDVAYLYVTAEELQNEEKDKSDKNEKQSLLSRTAIFRQDLGHATENVIRLWNKRPYAVYMSNELEIFRHGGNRERGALGNLRDKKGTKDDAVDLIDMVNYDEEKRQEEGINDKLFTEYNKIKEDAIDECLRLCEIVQPGFENALKISKDNPNEGGSITNGDRLELPTDPSDKKEEKKKGEKKQPEADK